MVAVGFFTTFLRLCCFSKYSNHFPFRVMHRSSARLFAGSGLLCAFSQSYRTLRQSKRSWVRGCRFHGTLVHQAAATRTCCGGPLPGPVLHIKAPIRASNLCASERKCALVFFLKGLADILMSFRMVFRHPVLPVSATNQCCACLMLVSGTSLIRFSICPCPLS